MAGWGEVFVLAGGFEKPDFKNRIQGLLDAFVARCGGIAGVTLAVYTYPEKHFLEIHAAGGILPEDVLPPFPPPPAAVWEGEEEVLGKELRTVTLPLYTANFCAALKVYFGDVILFKNFAYTVDIIQLLDSLNMALELYDTSVTMDLQNREFVHSLAAALDARDAYTRLHSSRAAQLAVLLAIAVGISSREIDVIKRGSLLHDIGKLAVPDRVLFKKGPLTADEWELIKIHPEAGAHIVRNRALAELVPVILFHHERADGSGYPMGLKGREIPLEAQILSVADVYEALTADRAYRLALSHEGAKKVMWEDMKGQFAERLMEKFFSLLENFPLRNLEELDRELPAICEGAAFAVGGFFVKNPFEIASPQELSAQLKLSVEAVDKELRCLCREGFLCQLKAYDTAYYCLPARWKSAPKPLAAGDVLPGLCPPFLTGETKPARRENDKEALLELLSLKCLKGDGFCLNLFFLPGFKELSSKRPAAAFLRHLERELQVVLC